VLITGLWLCYMSFFKRLLRSALIAPFLVATANAVICDGNVTMSLGRAAIKSLTFTYGSDGLTGVTDPTYLHVGLSGISFTPIPEISPAWSAVGSCLLAFALILRHSAKFRK
jgi:hypothetical protein